MTLAFIADHTPLMIVRGFGPHARTTMNAPGVVDKIRAYWTLANLDERIVTQGAEWRIQPTAAAQAREC